MDEPHLDSLVHPSIFFQALKDTKVCAQKGCGRTVLGSESDIQELCEECKPSARLPAPYAPPRPLRLTNGILCIFSSKGEYASELHSDPNLNYRKCMEIAAKQKLKRLYSNAFIVGNGAYPPQTSSAGTHKRSVPRRHPTIIHPSQTHNFVPSQIVSSRRHHSMHSDVNVVANRRASDPTFPISNNLADLSTRRRVSHPSNGRQDPRRSYYPAVPCCQICQLKLPKHWPGKLCQKCRSDMVSQPARRADLEPHAPASKPREVLDLTLENSPFPLHLQPGEPSSLKIKSKSNKLTASSPLQNSTTNNQLFSAPAQPIQPVDLLKTKQPGDQKLSIPTLRDLKLCATFNCTGSVPSGSGGMRCLACVKTDWKRRKRNVSPASDRISTSTDGSQLFPILKPVCEVPKRRKSVTWSETITEQSADGEILRRPVIDCDNEVIEVHDHDDQMCVENDVGGLNTMSGWDSELSELTSSDGEEHEIVSVRTGFKIRLPARPHGISVRACGNPRCTQRLDSDYRWKTCVLCRAKSREYQRKRYNVENSHNRLNDELVQHHNQTSTMRALDTITPNISRAISVIPRPVGAVSQSRLCLTAQCSHVLPSHDEYPLDVCSLCRLRRMDCEPPNPNGEIPCEPLPSSTLDLRSKDLLQAFIRLPDQTHQDGRCRSQDCGFILHPGSLCRQCVARRFVLLKLARLLVDDVSKESTPSSPSETRSYPRFQGFSALLTNFGGSLSGFFKAQSVFYLMKVAEPILVDAKAMFSFDGEYSVVTANYNVLQRKAEVDAQALEYKKEFERLGKIKFVPKRLVSILESGGVSVRFICQHKAPIFEAVKKDDEVTVRVVYKTMHGELEIATLPDRSHCFLPGHKTIIRFRLLG
ncbi:hypothetical protein CPB83DRAFT_889204 [Crepidotus variabilis]|uniref:Uncharacterized protein n=1 Tax=Crepidotus variabilis TaxID=179855 RepID=A0A9P6ES12_9AGAR|nr:hypothetical protein CPB83DRAFT_889204 [Crepidotus variabilis]